MKAIYWTTTILISAFLLFSSYTYLFSKATIDGIKDLGFPDFFRIQLAVLKFIAVFLLLIPVIPIQIKVKLLFTNSLIIHGHLLDLLFKVILQMIMLDTLLN